MLTFDDGPGPSTCALLDVLRDAGCRATFFVLGANLAQRPALGRRIVADGHGLGNHTWSHARAGCLTDAALRAELQATDALIRLAYAEAGQPAPSVIPVRLPYGTSLCDPRPTTLAALGRAHVGWTLLLPDWERPSPSAHALTAMMLAHVAECTTGGLQAVFCLHDASRHGEARPATVDAVRAFLQASSKPAPTA